MQNRRHSATEIRVSVVDVEWTGQMLIGAALEPWRFVPHSALRADEATTLAEVARPAVVSVEVLMTGTSGLDRCRQWRVSEVMWDVPVIFVTGVDDGSYHWAGTAAGGFDIIQRPYDLDELAERVADCGRRGRTSVAQRLLGAAAALGPEGDLEGLAAALERTTGLDPIVDAPRPQRTHKEETP